MSTEHPAGEPGYERRDVAVRPVVLALVAIIAMLVVVSLAMVPLLRGYRGREARRSPPPSPLVAYGPQEPPPPRLQTDPLKDLEDLRAAEDALLHGSGWVDRQAGVVRIPVERAMELVAERQSQGKR